MSSVPPAGSGGTPKTRSGSTPSKSTRRKKAKAGKKTSAIPPLVRQNAAQDIFHHPGIAAPRTDAGTAGSKTADGIKAPHFASSKKERVSNSPAREDYQDLVAYVQALSTDVERSDVLAFMINREDIPFGEIEAVLGAIDVNALDGTGTAPLEHAWRREAGADDAPITRALLERGANPFAGRFSLAAQASSIQSPSLRALVWERALDHMMAQPDFNFENFADDLRLKAALSPANLERYAAHQHSIKGTVSEAESKDKLEGFSPPMFFACHLRARLETLHRALHRPSDDMPEGAIPALRGQILEDMWTLQADRAGFFAKTEEASTSIAHDWQAEVCAGGRHTIHGGPPNHATYYTFEALPAGGWRLSLNDLGNPPNGAPPNHPRTVEGRIWPLVIEPVSEEVLRSPEATAFLAALARGDRLERSGEDWRHEFVASFARDGAQALDADALQAGGFLAHWPQAVGNCVSKNKRASEYEGWREQSPGGELGRWMVAQDRKVAVRWGSKLKLAKKVEQRRRYVLARALRTGDSPRALALLSKKADRSRGIFPPHQVLEGALKVVNAQQGRSSEDALAELLIDACLQGSADDVALLLKVAKRVGVKESAAVPKLDGNLLRQAVEERRSLLEGDQQESVSAVLQEQGFLAWKPARLRTDQ